MYNVGKLFIDTVYCAGILFWTQDGEEEVSARRENQKLLLAAARNQSPEKSKAIIPTK